MKYIVVMGSGLSGIGKGVLISSVGALLQACGRIITIIKIDPYLVIIVSFSSAKTYQRTWMQEQCPQLSMVRSMYLMMGKIQKKYSMIYFFDNRGECDLDLGNYERYNRLRLTRYHNITTGKVYNSVIKKERKGEYLGKTVQVVPHITNEIIE